MNHHISGDLLPHEANNLVALQGKRCLIEKSAVVQVLFAHPKPNQWVVQHMGVACYIKDSEKKSFFIRVFDVENPALLWEHEIYKGFEYRTIKEFFHTFAGEHCEIGLNFANDGEAYEFGDCINSRLLQRRRRREVRLSEQQSAQGGMQPNPTTPAPSLNGLFGKSSVPPPVPTQARPPISSMPRSGGQSQLSPMHTPLFQVGTPHATAQSQKNKKGKGHQVPKKIVKTDIGLPTNFKLHHLGYGMQRINPLNSSTVGPEEEKMLELLREMGVSVPKGQEDFAFNYLKERGGAEKLRSSLASSSSAFHSPDLVTSSSLTTNQPPTLAEEELLGSIVNDSSNNNIVVHQSQVVQTEVVMALQQKLNEAEEKTICPICLDNSIEVVFQCGHLLCHECSDQVMECPICRSEIVNRINVFL